MLGTIYKYKPEKKFNLFLNKEKLIQKLIFAYVWKKKW